MKNFFFYCILCALTICLVPQILIAKTGYVSDLLLLTFREGPGTSYTVIKTLESSTPVNIIEEQDGFYKVELQSKEIGWVDKKFIIFQTPKIRIIKQLEQDIKSFEKKVSNLESANEALKGQLSSSNDEKVQKIQSLETSLQSSLSENKALTHSLSENNRKYNTLIQQSKNIQTIITDNETLKQENQSLNTKLAALEKKNKSILKIGMIKWFLAGVGTLILGWVLGQSISSRRRSGSSLI
ncbi:MAG: TIGR04211 family SH3 domain-containing protein [Pseudomonadota bacterium]